MAWPSNEVWTPMPPRHPLDSPRQPPQGTLSLNTNRLLLCLPPSSPPSFPSSPLSLSLSLSVCVCLSICLYIYLSIHLSTYSPQEKLSSAAWWLELKLRLTQLGSPTTRSNAPHNNPIWNWKNLIRESVNVKRLTFHVQKNPTWHSHNKCIRWFFCSTCSTCSTFVLLNCMIAHASNSKRWTYLFLY